MDKTGKLVIDRLQILSMLSLRLIPKYNITDKRMCPLSIQTQRFQNSLYKTTENTAWSSMTPIKATEIREAEVTYNFGTNDEN
jgi:hypothetical protein